MAEPLSNLRFPCSQHAPRANPKYAKMSPESFLRKYVKTAFKGIDLEGRERLEHMWVKVTGAGAETGMLYGTLNNDPVLKMDLKDGDSVSVSINDIEELLE